MNEVYLSLLPYIEKIHELHAHIKRHEDLALRPIYNPSREQP